MTIPKTMKAAVAHDYNDIRIEQIEVPRPGPGEALVKVRALGICTGDVTPWYVHKKCPCVLGHEPTGDIVEVGAGVTKFKPGDRVYFHHHAPCGRCHHCLRGDFSMCETWRASHLTPGGAAEYCLIPEGNLSKDTLILPDTMSYAEGTLIEPMACVVRAYKRARLKPGDTVAIMGLGVMGQMMAVLAKHLEAGLIMGSDKVPYRLEKGLELGLDKAIDITKESFPEAVKRETGEGADIVMVCPTSPEAVLEGIRCAGRASRVLMFMGPKPGTPLTIDMNEVYFNEIDLISSYSSGPTETREAMWLINDGVGTEKQLITHHFDLDHFQDGVELTHKAGQSLKVVIDIA